METMVWRVCFHLAVLLVTATGNVVIQVDYSPRTVIITNGQAEYIDPEPAQVTCDPPELCRAEIEEDRIVIQTVPEVMRDLVKVSSDCDTSQERLEAATSWPDEATTKLSWKDYKKEARKKKNKKNKNKKSTTTTEISTTPEEFVYDDYTKSNENKIDKSVEVFYPTQDGGNYPGTDTYSKERKDYEVFGSKKGSGGKYSHDHENGNDGDKNSLDMDIDHEDDKSRNSEEVNENENKYNEDTEDKSETTDEYNNSPESDTNISKHGRGRENGNDHLNSQEGGRYFNYNNNYPKSREEKWNSNHDTTLAEKEYPTVTEYYNVNSDKLSTASSLFSGWSLG